MNIRRKFRIRSVTVTQAALAVLLGLAAAAPVQASEGSAAKLRIFTFTGTPTARLLAARDYDEVVRASRRAVTHFGYHDLVNLCAAHAFEGRYGAAERACTRAVNHRPSRSVNAPASLKRERWAAYANRGVARALTGDRNGAREDFATALAKGGDAGGLAHNFAILEAATDAALVGLATAN